MDIEEIVAMKIPVGHRVEIGVLNKPMWGGVTFLDDIMGYYVGVREDKVYFCAKKSMTKKSRKGFRAEEIQHITPLYDEKEIKKREMTAAALAPTCEMTGSDLPDYQTQPGEETSATREITDSNLQNYPTQPGEEPSDIRTRIDTRTLPGAQEVIAQLEESDGKTYELAQVSTNEIVIESGDFEDPSKGKEYESTDAGFRTATQWPHDKNK